MRTLLAAFTLSVLLNGCTLVGLIGGSLEDKADHIEKDEITREDQHIRLERFEQSTVFGTYKGLIAAGDSLSPGDTAAIARQPIFLQSFNQEYTIHMRYDQEPVRGTISGLYLPDELYFFHLKSESDDSFVLIPLKAVSSLEDSSGTFYPISDPELPLYVVVTNSGVPRALPLGEISRIKPSGLNTVVATTAMGLVVDIGLVISASQSINNMNIWGE